MKNLIFINSHLLEQPPSHTQPVLVRGLRGVRVAGDRAQGQLEPGRVGGFPAAQTRFSLESPNF